MKCLICGKKAVHRFSPDLDIEGLGSCNEHVEDVQMAYMMLMQGEHEMYASFVKRRKELYDKLKVKIN